MATYADTATDATKEQMRRIFQRDYATTWQAATGLSGYKHFAPKQIARYADQQQRFLATRDITDKAERAAARQAIIGEYVEVRLAAWLACEVK